MTVERMTVEQINADLARYTYRPGWTFTAAQHLTEGVTIRIVGPVEDADHPGTYIDLGIDDWLPPMPDTDSLRSWMAWRLWRVEAHESREWFRVDGAHHDNPHPTPPR